MPSSLILMANIYNSDLTKELVQGAKIQTSFEKVPSQIADKVVPVMEVNPKMLKEINLAKYATRTTTGSSTVYTPPTDRDFYLTGYAVSLVKDAACDSSTGNYLFFTLADGTVQRVYFHMVPSQANSLITTYTFSHPIKLARNQSISLNLTFTAGTMTATASIVGFLVENVNA